MSNDPNALEQGFDVALGTKLGRHREATQIGCERCCHLFAFDPRNRHGLRLTRRDTNVSIRTKCYGFRCWTDASPPISYAFGDVR